MDDVPVPDARLQRLARLLEYLDYDPGNLALMGEACATALDASQADTVLDILARYGATSPLPPLLLNFKGLAHLKRGDHELAIDIFDSLLCEAPDEPNLKFNLAWSRSMIGDHARASELLDDMTLAAVPQAAELKIRALHHLGKLEEALRLGMLLAEERPGDASLAGALSLVAMDGDLPDLARAWALKAQDTPDGLSSLGVLTLQDNRVEDALNYFELGLAARPDSARNLLGKGLALMAMGDAAGAASYIDQSAGIFGRHLGTWIASGWAHFAAGDRGKARSVFEHALSLDDTFSESHGALAVLDCLDNDLVSARRRAETAQRLDPRGFAGALARMLLLEHDGDGAAAEKLRDRALNTPLDASGRTIAQAMMAIAPRWRSPRG